MKKKSINSFNNFKISQRQKPKKLEKFKQNIIYKKKTKFLVFYIHFVFLIFFCNNSTKSTFDYLNLFIIAHKDFSNKLINPYYKIICDNKTYFKNKYKLNIIETYENELYQKKLGYCEGSKIYYIWKKYKIKEISTKYVGFVHYRRIFSFKNKIPNLDKIFIKYDAIINKKSLLNESIKIQYYNNHIGKFLDEIEEIIKDNFTEYYTSALKTLDSNLFSCCNIFIMKSEDFIKYGEFVFGILFEFDRRHKIKNDNDIKKLIEFEIKKSGNKTSIDYQCRQEAFLMERISCIFYDYYFQKVLEIPIGFLNQ